MLSGWLHLFFWHPVPQIFRIVTSTPITTGTTSSAFHFRIYFLVHWQSKINILAFFLFFFILPDRVLLTGLNDLIEYHKVYVCLILFEFWFCSVDLPFVCIVKNTVAELNHIWSIIFFSGLNGHIADFLIYSLPFIFTHSTVVVFLFFIYSSFA